MLKFIEGFELYGGSTSVPAEMQAKWTVVADKSCKPKGSGRLLGYSCELGYQYGTGTEDSLTTPQFGDHNTWVVGFGINRSSGDGSYYAVGDFLIVLNGSSIACRLHRTDTSIELKNAAGSTLHTWSSLDPATDVWQYMEAKFVVNGASSSCELKLDGVSLGSSGTKTFSQSTANKVRFTGMSYGGLDAVSYLLDDVYICDGSGSAQNDFLGICAVEGIVPSGAGASTDGTPSTGANYACVDEKPSNSDTDFVTLSTAGDHDSYTFGDLTTLTNVIGVQFNAVSKQTSGLEDLAFVQRHSSTDYEVTAFDGSQLSTYKTTWAVSTAIDNASTAYTVSNINAAEFGIKIVSA